MALSAAKPVAPMTNYRRNVVSGATYFFTVNLSDRRLALLIDNIDALRAAFRETRSRHPFAIDTIVVLPDHLHAIWTLPEGDGDFAVRWSLIKARFSRALPPDELTSASRRRRRERGIWQRRYWEHTIRSEDDFDRHVDYIHFNPVKHGYIENVADWPFSSFHRMVRQGLYPANWAIGATDTLSAAKPIIGGQQRTAWASRRSAHPTLAPDPGPMLARLAGAINSDASDRGVWAKVIV